MFERRCKGFYNTRVVSVVGSRELAAMFDSHFGSHTDVRLRLGHLLYLGAFNNNLIVGPVDDETECNSLLRSFVEENIDEWRRLVSTHSKMVSARF
jgi:hypothetical protein